MSTTLSREIRLASRPTGVPTPSNFSLATVEVGPLAKGQVLVRNYYVSVDPYMRGRMNEGESYVPPFAIDQPLTGGAVGVVLESESDELEVGSIVTSNYGWREYFVAGPAELHKVSADVQTLSVYLGALGMTGMTAWAGLKLVDTYETDIVYISAAAGAVGNVAGQLAKRQGCYVIGSAGSDEKVKFLKEECRFDAAFNYRTAPVLTQLKEVAPKGIDVYFDNVGGESLEAALSTLKIYGRIIACGAIAHYNNETPTRGPTNLFNMITKRLTMKGLIVSDSWERRSEFENEVSPYLRDGSLINKETVSEGIDSAVDAFIGLFSGENIGKMVVKLV